MHVTNWAAAQKEDPELEAVLQWLESKEKTTLRTLLGEYVLMRICYCSWCQRHTRLPPLMGVIGMQDIKAMTILSPCYKNVSGSQVWPSR